MGPLAWFADQQISATTAYARCPEQSPRFVVTVGIVCALVAIAGALISLSARTSPAEASGTERFIVLLSWLLPAVSLFAIILGTAAGLILPCDR
jgi:hypothetical protein